MNRRTFIRVVGGVGLTSMVPFRYVVGAEKAARSTSGILVEAASFAKPGGWKLDTPHYPNGHADAKKAQTKREATMAASGVDLFTHHIAIGLEKDGEWYWEYSAQEVHRIKDAVVTERRFIDLHHQKAMKGAKQDFLSWYIFRHTDGDYYIPFRCLYSRNIGNLMMAGRCFSCSHVGLGGPRNMRTLGQMGVATGLAAALCKKHGVLPRGVYEKHVKELRALAGYA